MSFVTKLHLRRSATKMSLAATVALVCGSASAGTPDTVAIDAHRLDASPRELVTSDSHMMVRGPTAASVADIELYRSSDGRLIVDEADYDKVELGLSEWPVDEFMYFVDGRLGIAGPKEDSRDYGPGDAIVMPRGFAGTWKQHSRIRKIAVAYSADELPLESTAAKDSPARGPAITTVTKADLAGATTHMEPLVAWEPFLEIEGSSHSRYFEKPLYRSKDGRLTVQVKRFEPVALRLSNWPLDEVMHLFRGQVTIQAASGRPRVYKAPDTFVLPRGFSGSWRQNNVVDMLTVEYDATRKH